MIQLVLAWYSRVQLGPGTIGASVLHQGYDWGPGTVGASVLEQCTVGVQPLNCWGGGM